MKYGKFGALVILSLLAYLIYLLASGILWLFGR